jgi:hypothetical protein
MPETAAPVHGIPDSQESPSPPESTWLEIPENWEDLDDPVPSKKASSSVPEPEKPEAPASKPPPPRKKEEKKETEPEAVFSENNWY